MTIRNRITPRSTKVLPFTLIELLVAMAVFSLLMLSLMQFFSAAQNLWTKTAAKTTMFEDARIALDLMARDLQSSYYEVDHATTKCYFELGDATSNSYADEIRLVTSASSLPNGNCKSRLCEVRYKIVAGSGTNPDWLCVSYVGDYDSGGSLDSNWDFSSDFTGGSASQIVNPNAFDTPANPTWRKIIPYVTDLKFTCFRKDGTAYNQQAGGDKLPYAVHIELSILDRDHFVKWKAVSGSDARLKDPFVRKFSRTVIIERGQYD